MRWQTISGREFPLNDGGYGDGSSNALKGNHFILPEFVQFNGVPLSTYYPPLAGYLLGAISDLFNLDVLVLLLWFPFGLCIGMILSFYALAERLYNEQLTPRLAVIMFALSPISYRWFVMGGGVSRCLGIIFLMGALTLLLKPEQQRPRCILAGFLGLGSPF